MPWDVAERRHVDGTVEHRVWHALRRVVAARSGLPALHASYEVELLDPVVPTVLAWARRAPGQVLVALHNTSEHPQTWPRSAVPLAGPLHDVLAGEVLSEDGDVELGPYGCRWLVSPVS